MTWEALVAVGVVARDGQSRLFAQSHTAVDVEDTLIPTCVTGSVSHIIVYKSRIVLTLDDLTDTDAGLEVTTTDGRVEPEDLLAVECHN